LHQERTRVVFVEMSRAPEAQFPIPLEEAYAATKYVQEQAPNSISRLSSGRRRRWNRRQHSSGRDAPRQGTSRAKIAFQVLFYPVTDARFDTASYERFAMVPGSPDRHGTILECLFAGRRRRDTLPRRRFGRRSTSCGAFRGPHHYRENDVVRDEGEAYARKLWDACVA